MVLHISHVQYQRIGEALAAAYPHEGCGLLVGRRVFEAFSTQEIYREVSQVIPVANAWEPSLLDYTDGATDGEMGAEDSPDRGRSDHDLRDRYWIDPADLLRVQKSARDQGLAIIGIYHSHPDHPAVPSECDRRLAWPVYSYLIASVGGGQVVDGQSWRLNDHLQFEPEMIHVTLTETGTSSSLFLPELSFTQKSAKRL